MKQIVSLRESNVAIRECGVPYSIVGSNEIVSFRSTGGRSSSVIAEPSATIPSFEGHKGALSYFGKAFSVISILLLIAILFIPDKLSAQQVSVRTNLLYWATGTPNAGVEVKLADRWSLGVHGGYNPFLYRSWQDEDGNTYNPKMIHWTVMPEAKFWFCKTFERSYLGLHGMYGEFNVGALRIIPKLKHERYWGNMFGVGLSYGYQLPLGKRGGVEFSIGAGWIRFNYNRCDAWVCGADLGSSHRDYFGPTKAAITFSYYLR